ncbi:MAG: hypothetical protein JO224_03640 [Pelomonas sp.]|nr:hypothetical protein [Roseateles sp.]
MKKSVIHAAAGALAMLTVATFWTSTLWSELFMNDEAVIAVKHAIVYFGLIPLVTLMAVTGGSGFYFAKGRKGRLVEDKKKRMPKIGANGLLVMIPCALFLNSKAAGGEFDAVFYAVQGIELVVGAVQLTLLGRSFRDGLKLAGRLRPKPAKD